MCGEETWKAETGERQSRTLVEYVEEEEGLCGNFILLACWYFRLENDEGGGL